MMFAVPARWRTPASFVALSMGSGLLALSALLVADHAATVERARELLPAAVDLPRLEQHLAVLQEQMEVASVEEAMRGNPAQEQLRAHVLPAVPRLQSLLGAFDLLRDQMTHDGLLESMSTMQVGDPIPLHDAYGLSVQPMTVTFVGSEQGISTLMLFAEIAGDLTVADTLSSEEIDALLAATEAENPAAVTAVERFLSLNLLTYARTAQRSEDDLAKSFASPSFLSQLRTILERSRLSAARCLLGGAFGAKLEEHRLWPLQFLTVERSALDDLGGGRFRLALEMSAYLREGE